MLLVTKRTLNTHMSRSDDNHQNCRTNFVALPEPQSSDFSHQSKACKNYADSALQLHNWAYERQFNCFWNFESLQNVFKAWNPFFVHMLHPKMKTFDQCWAGSRKVKDVNFGLATERIQVIMCSNYGSQKYFGRTSFDEVFENILKRLKSIPSVECPFHFYIVSVVPTKSFF